MKRTRKWIALLLSLLMLMTVCIGAMAEEPVPETTEEAVEEVAAPEQVSYYQNYVSIGDSCGSGVGLPQYLELARERNVRWIGAEQIEGSYPTLVAKAVGATSFGQYHFPGARTADIRYLLDENYYADWVLLGQAMYLSNGVVSKANMDAYRDEVIEAVQNADLITLDVGINDVWLPVIAAIYDIAGEGRVFGRQLTVPELVARYGSVGAFVDNALSFVNAWVLHPLQWPGYALKLMNALIKWAVDYQINTGAIMDRIYQLNPDATVVVCGLYNPVNDWDAVPLLNDHLIERILQPYYTLLNLRKRLAVQFYRGNAVYVEMNDIELISDHFTIPLFEFTTEREYFGYNPHPTLEGAKQQAANILDKLGVPMD